jgi:hypothetical protein
VPGRRRQRGAVQPPRSSELPDFTDTAALALPTARRGERSDPDRPETPRQHRWRASRADDLPGGLAAIGLAGEHDELDPVEELEIAVREDVIPSHRAAPAEPEPNPLPVAPGDEESRPISVRRIDRSDRTYGDRVDGWVRPEYHDDRAEPPAGEYWTPLPMDDLDLEPPGDDPEPSARGYGWPIPVERLPAVPDYEPATGFDLTPVATEPTELVPAWPPMPDRGTETSRTRGGDGSTRAADRRNAVGKQTAAPPAGDNPAAELPAPPAELPGEPDVPGEQPAPPHGALPHAWAGRDLKPAGNRFLENEPHRPTPADADQRFRAPTGEPERRRPRPRPRPAATTADNVYVSRHAADPPL